MIEKYFEARLDLIYKNNANIGHDYIREYGNKIIQYIICIDIYKFDNYKYGFIRFIIKIGKIFNHIIPQYAN